MFGPGNAFCNSLFGFWRFNGGGFMIMGILFILFIVLAVILFKRNSSGRYSDSESPLETLQKRYVNSEISKEEFLEKKKILNA